MDLIFVNVVKTKWRVLKVVLIIAFIILVFILEMENNPQARINAIGWVLFIVIFMIVVRVLSCADKF